MFTQYLKSQLLLLTSGAIWLGAASCLSTGCAYTKAVDTTKMIQAQTAGESHVTYTLVPGDIAGMPDNVIAIPTVPGKDIEFKSYYPDGTPQWSLVTKRSVVLEMMNAGVLSVDAAKALQEQFQLQWLSEEAQKWRDFAMQAASSGSFGFGGPQSQQPPQTQPVDTGKVDKIIAVLEASKVGKSADEQAKIDGLIALIKATR